MDCPFCNEPDQIADTICDKCKRYIIAPKKNSCLGCLIGIAIIVVVLIVVLYLVR